LQGKLAHRFFFFRDLINSYFLINHVNRNILFFDNLFYFRLSISMDELSSITTIDQKMAKMRIKNLELLKRHQVCTWIHTNYLFEAFCIKGKRKKRRLDDWYLSSKRPILFPPYVLYSLECHCNKWELFFDNVSPSSSSLASNKEHAHI